MVLCRTLVWQVSPLDLGKNKYFQTGLSGAKLLIDTLVWNPFLGRAVCCQNVLSGAPFWKPSLDPLSRIEFAEIYWGDIPETSF